MQLAEFRLFFGIGCRVMVLLSTQVRPKDVINHEDVIKRPDALVMASACASSGMAANALNSSLLAHDF
ncbi:hypothetical protein [Limnohabitans sp. 2KL-17]|uniref:hypothetical protein n=1 Tax=Limnohabitans sp. 2KL-17 TaxID=1100704 RepID=UPI001E397C6D|nr:hypothetical protein [Limnohabitans sp. 2KL-17]